MKRLVTRIALFGCLLGALGACSATQVNVGSGPAMEQKQTAQMVKGFATQTPPSGSHSMGMMSSPRAGTTTIPISNAEVYTFTANVDDDDSAETLYWAFDDDVVYVWGSFDLVCVDEDDVETGETGDADFILEADDEGYAWMVATDSCGYSTLYGCEANDGEDEVCGGCDWDDTFIVCEAD